MYLKFAMNHISALNVYAFYIDFWNYLKRGAKTSIYIQLYILIA